MRNVFVTGGTGFVGKHLVRGLVSKGYRVKCLVRPTSNVTELVQLGVELVTGDLLYDGHLDLTDDLKDIDTIYHLVGGGNVSTISGKGYYGLYRLNVTSTLNLLKTSYNIKRFILFSSTSAMGIQPNTILDEKSECKPKIPHERVKFLSERTARILCERHKIPLTILRPSLICGEDDSRSEFVAMCRRIKKHTFPIIGYGDNIMPIVYVGDVVQSAVRAGENNSNRDNTYILVGERLSLNEIVATIASELDTNFVFTLPIWSAYIGASVLELASKFSSKEPLLNKHRVMSISSCRVYNTNKAKEELAFNPSNTKDKIQQTVRWLRENETL